MKKDKKFGPVVQPHGYWLWPDGFSHWGINCRRFGDEGIEITKEDHGKSTDEKTKLFADTPKSVVKSVEE